VQKTTATEPRCPACRCDAIACAADETGEHCLTVGCAAGYEGCPLDDCPVCGPSTDTIQQGSYPA